MAPKPAGHCCEIVDDVVNSQVLDYVPLACENSERREPIVLHCRPQPVLNNANSAKAALSRADGDCK